MGVVIRAGIAGPPVAWAIGLQSPMVKIGTPATNYTARWLSLGRLEIRQMNGITARNLKPVFCNIWFCGRLFLLLLLFCLFRAHFHELVAAVSRTIRTRSEQIAQKQRKKKNDCFTFWPLRDESTFTTWGHPDRQQKKIYSGRIVYTIPVQQVNEIFFSFYFTSCIQLARNLKTKKNCLTFRRNNKFCTPSPPHAFIVYSSISWRVLRDA